MRNNTRLVLLIAMISSFALSRLLVSAEAPKVPSSTAKAAVKVAGDGIAPPPPSFNLQGGEAVGGDPNRPEDKGELKTGDETTLTGKDTVDMAAPQISEDQVVKNNLEVAYQLYHAEDYENAGKTAAAILEKFPKKKIFWVRYLYALCLEHQEMYAKAEEQYIKVKKESPRSTYSNASTFRIGVCQMRMGQDGEATYTFHEVIETNPRSEYRLQSYVHLGNLYRRARNWKAAQGIYKDLIRLYPETTWSHTGMMYLAECYAYQYKTEQAKRIYKQMQVTESVPVVFKAQAQLRVGDLEMTEQNWQEAIGAYRMAIRDYNQVPGIAMTAEQKIVDAQEGRRAGRVEYRRAKGPTVSVQTPADEAYRLAKEKETAPY